LVYKQILSYFEVMQLPGVGPVVIAQDPSEELFLYCAFAEGPSFVITGDRHLLALKSWQEIAMMAPAAFLQKFSL
jgi:predicted nucleic acid-binding protein